MKIIHLTAFDDPDIKPAVRQLAGAADPVVARRGRMLLDLVSHLEGRGPAPSAFGYLWGEELWLSPTNQYNRAPVHVRADSQDYGRARDGFPEVQYRLSIRRQGFSLSREERARELPQVEHLIWEAFGWASMTSGERS